MLAFKAVGTRIPDASGVAGSGSKGAVEFPGNEAKFDTRVYNAQVAIQTFKLDQVDNEHLKPIDLVQVGAKDVKITGTNKNVVEYVIKTDYSLRPAGNYTGEVIVLVIADVARP
jgi:hypothetical protein